MINKIILWVPAVIWMSVIFYMSAQPAAESNSLSKVIIERIIETLGRIFSIDVETITSNNLVSQLNHCVRKSAHFIIYFILGILVAFVLVKNDLKHKVFCITFLFCVLFAISDEIHQLFVPGRGGMLEDLTLDSLGALTGIVFYFLAKKSERRRS